MIRKITIRIGLALLLVMVCAAALSADPVAWTSFNGDATITGITQSPSWADGVLTYKLCVAPGAQITLAGGDGPYDINSVFGFYAMGVTRETAFSATGSDIVIDEQHKWTFDSSTQPGYIFGWEGSANAVRITPGNCMSFTYTTFSVPVGAALLTGLHISYGTSGATDFFKTELPVPEVPTSIVMGLGSMLTAGMMALRRRFHI